MSGDSGRWDSTSGTVSDCPTLQGDRICTHTRFQSPWATFGSYPLPPDHLVESLLERLYGALGGEPKNNSVIPPRTGLVDQIDGMAVVSPRYEQVAGCCHECPWIG